MDEVVLDDINVVLDDGDTLVVSKTREKTEEVIVISDSESVPESAPVSPVKKKVKQDDAYPLGEYSKEQR